LNARERLIVELVRTLQREHRIGDEQFAAAEAELGRERVVELVGLAGYYAMIALVLVGFQVEPKLEGAPPF
jgi:4-carboxymuconolactone decarboxylase